MKTKIKRVLMPITVIAFAIAGAYAGTRAEKESFSPEIGYAKNILPCDTQVNCVTQNTGHICTIQLNGDSVQAFGKDSPSSTSCMKTLYRPL